MSPASRALAFISLALPLALSLPQLACAEGETGDPHPVDRLDFPVAVTVDPSGRLVWVVSGNFDLAWRGAGVLAIDVLENRFVPELAFEVGDFPGPLTLLEKDGRALAGYIASRDEDSVYTVYFGGDDPARPEPSCKDGVARAGTILHCPKSGAIRDNDIDVDGKRVRLTVGRDPYQTLVRPGRRGGEPDLLFVGGMRDGMLATLALSGDGTPRLIGDIELSNGLFGLVTSPATGRLYATSKLAPDVTVLDVGARFSANDPTLLDPLNPYLRVVASVAIPEPALVRDRARALAISGDGTRLYATYRAPDALIILDIADDPAGNPRGRVLQRVPLADDPGDIEVVTTDAGDELLYVSCFRGDRVEVIDARSGAILDSIKVGQGPSEMALVDRPDLGVRRLYVALFNDHAVGVIELDPASPFYHTEIGEIR
jgi:DNA-binding beta-propeller fold protein YncE